MRAEPRIPRGPLCLLSDKSPSGRLDDTLAQTFKGFYQIAGPTLFGSAEAAIQVLAGGGGRPRGVGFGARRGLGRTAWPLPPTANAGLRWFASGRRPPMAMRRWRWQMGGWHGHGERGFGGSWASPPPRPDLGAEVAPAIVPMSRRGEGRSLEHFPPSYTHPPTHPPTDSTVDSPKGASTREHTEHREGCRAQ